MGRTKRVAVEDPTVIRGSKTLELETCSMFDEKCRHCSHEHTYRPCTRIVKDPTSKIWKPVGLDRIEIDLGLYCNDAGQYVDEMHYCPVKWSKSKWERMIKEYLEKEVVKKRPAKVTEVKPQKKRVVTNKPIKKVVTKDVSKRKL